LASLDRNVVKDLLVAAHKFVTGSAESPSGAQERGNPKRRLLAPRVRML
jgi:hypothetical protein